MIHFREKQFVRIKRAVKTIQNNSALVSIPLSMTSVGLIAHNSMSAARDRKRESDYRARNLEAMGNLTNRLDTMSGTLSNTTNSINKVNSTLTKNNNLLGSGGVVRVNTVKQEPRKKEDDSLFGRIRRKIGY